MRNKLVQLLFMTKDSVIISLIILLLLLVVMKLLKKNINRKKLLLDYVFVWYMCVLFEVTGLIGIFRMTQFKWKWFVESFDVVRIVIPRSIGEIEMMLCNCVLFVPFGLLLPMVFKKINGIKVLIISCVLVVIIELLQAAGGRMLEVNDIVMNTCGAMIGYLIYYLFTSFFGKRKNR